MRTTVIISILFASILLLYKWRYRLLNIVLALATVRKLVVTLSMKCPYINKKFKSLSLSRSTE